MDIGTAKPSADQRRRVPHHLIDVVDPDEVLSLAQVQAMAYAAIDDILARGRRPLLVGGTGLTVRAVTEGLRIPAVPPNLELRAELEARAEREGRHALHVELQQVDPAAAARIDPRNVRRTIRALEVYRVSGRRFSDMGNIAPPPYRIVAFGLHLPRPELYARIDARVEEMMAAGLVEETRRLAQRYDWSLPSMSGLGYRQIGMFLRGECGEAEVVALIKRETRRFVRHQSNWFRADDARIRWLDARLEIDRDLLSTLQREADGVE